MNKLSRLTKENTTWKSRAPCRDVFVFSSPLHCFQWLHRSLYPSLASLLLGNAAQHSLVVMIWLEHAGTHITFQPPNSKILCFKATSLALQEGLHQILQLLYLLEEALLSEIPELKPRDNTRGTNMCERMKSSESLTVQSKCRKTGRIAPTTCEAIRYEDLKFSSQVSSPKSSFCHILLLYFASRVGPYAIA